jgi:hypothetical protein
MKTRCEHHFSNTSVHPRMHLGTLCLILLLFFGCGPKSEVVNPLMVSRVPDPRPLSIVLLPDYSGSGEEHHIPELVLRDIVVRPVEYFKTNGGQIAVGIIDGESDMTMCSCRVDPSDWPVLASEPVRYSFANDVAFRLAVTAYTDEMVPRYNAQRDSIALMIDVRIEAFLSCLDVMQKRTDKTHATDMFPVLNRAQYAHAQAPSSCVSHHTVVIGDGEGNRSGSLSSIADLPPIHYWCPYCTIEAPTTSWFNQAEPHTTIDLETAFDLIYHQ